MLIISPFKGERPKREQGRNTKQFTLKELNPQDKKRVANLVKELAKVGEERVYAEEKLQEERMAFEERLAILQEEYDAVIKEKHRILSCYVNTNHWIQNNEGRGKGYQPKPKAEDDNPYRDLDYSGYHKNRIQ